MILTPLWESFGVIFIIEGVILYFYYVPWRTHFIVNIVVKFYWKFYLYRGRFSIDLVGLRTIVPPAVPMYI